MLVALVVSALAVELLQLGVMLQLLRVILDATADQRARATAAAEMERAEAIAREADAQQQRWKQAPEHRIRPAQRGTNGWQTSCVCGWWSLPCGGSPDALGEAEVHLRDMPRRRAG